MNKHGQKINHLFFSMVALYSALLFIISAIAGYFAYQQEREKILSTMDLALTRMDTEYSNILENFWQPYMPLYETSSDNIEILRTYFASSPAEDLSPFERQKLKSALQKMYSQDSRIQWIGLYSNYRSVNYLLTSNDSGIQVMPADFPYLDKLQQKTQRMEIYGAKTVETTSGPQKTFAIAGGSPVGMGAGSIIIGYSLQNFEAYCNFTIAGLPSIRYCLTANDELIFDSTGSYSAQSIPSTNRSSLFVRSILSGDNTSAISYSFSQKELLISANRNLPFILSFTVLFAIISIIVHAFMSKSLKKELAVIRNGLNEIVAHNPSYHLPTDFNQRELPEIAQNINEIGSRLNENIKRAYYFELKQKDAQLAELQATFNPHFLYNTLEMLCDKSYANGDFETSELITQLASLFRGFINAKTFITIKEELAFCNRYVSLLSARYGDLVKIQYSIPGELLNYGIIRNVFQLIIENYFVHGFDADNKNSFIRFSGRSANETDLILSVQDNGTGITPDALEKLRRDIEAPIRHGEKSYGLKNLNQRLKLFYGPDYGLTIPPNQEHGFYLEIRLKKMYVSDYEKAKEE